MQTRRNKYEITNKNGSDLKIIHLVSLIIYLSVVVHGLDVNNRANQEFQSHRKSQRRLYPFPESKFDAFTERHLKNSLRKELRNIGNDRRSKNIPEEDVPGSVSEESLPSPEHGPVRQEVPAYSLDWVRKGKLRQEELNNELKSRSDRGDALLADVTEFGINKTNYLIRVHEPTLFSEGENLILKTPLMDCIFIDTDIGVNPFLSFY